MDKKKYIFFDVDGTIFTKEATVPESTKEAFKLAQINGHEIFVNTGRCKNIVPKEILDLNLDGIICGTGSYIEYHGDIVYYNTFSEEQTLQVANFFNKHKIPSIMTAEDTCVASKYSLKRFVDILSDGKIKLSDDDFDLNIIDSPFMNSVGPITIDDNINNYYKKYKKIIDFVYALSPFSVEELRCKISPDLNIEKASFKNPDEYSGEVTLSMCTKAKAINILADIAGFDIKNTVAFGDGFNDVEMLKAANLSIAMGNSVDLVKEISDFVTDDIYHDGVYKALKHYNFIE